MSNQELANLFYDIADMLDIQGIKWKPLAYRKAALTISTLSTDITEVYNQGKLRELEGVGEAICKKTEEYIKTGKIAKHEQLKKRYPIDFSTFRLIRGLGPRTAYTLYLKLKIKNLEDLKDALANNKIRGLEGFGVKSENELINSVNAFLKMGEQGRKPLGFVIEYINGIIKELRDSGIFYQVEIAGSTRRMKETVGDFDILSSAADARKATALFIKLKEVKEVLVSGETKTSVKLDNDMNCDLRVIDKNSFGAAMQYFTGNKDHNVKLRKIAISKGLKLNEYGLFKGKKSIAGKTEESVYSSLGMKVMPPELRENMGEIEASQEGRLPKLVEYTEIIGDLHAHTNDSDGANSLDEMVRGAKKQGLRYIAITNHSKSLKVAKGLDEKRFIELFNRIDRINETENDVHVLKGVELEILKDGSLDLPSKLLKQMDFVVAAVHQNTNQDRTELTNRALSAINSGLITSFAHPTGRIIGQREGMNIDLNKVFEACEKNSVCVEINGYPERSDLPFDIVKTANESHKLLFSLGSDSHRVDHLRFIHMATAIARRGWLEKRNVINAFDCKQVISLKR